MVLWMIACSKEILNHYPLEIIFCFLTLCGLSKSLLGLESSCSFILESLVILEQGHQGLGLLPHVETLVLVVLDKLEILEGLYCKYILLALLCNLKQQSLDN